MSSTPSVVAIFGPTGSGKTDVAVRVAASLGTEVVNCDPAQCYEGLPILTNQPTAKHDAIAAHRLVSSWPLTHHATIVEFAQLAHSSIDELVAKTGSAVLAGGSGLYMQAALTKLAGTSGAGDHRGYRHDDAVKQQLVEEFASQPPQRAHDRLRELDQQSAERIHPNDRKRVLRAVELALLGGGLSESSMWDAPLRLPTYVAALHLDRQTIRDRIDVRTQQMFDRGVVEEVARIAGEHGERADQVFSQTSLRLHGLDDCLRVLRGEWTTNQAVNKMATRTRQYAKRQDTWARRWPIAEVIQIDGQSVDTISERVTSR